MCETDNQIFIASLMVLYTGTESLQSFNHLHILPIDWYVSIPFSFSKKLTQFKFLSNIPASCSWNRWNLIASKTLYQKLTRCWDVSLTSFQKKINLWVVPNNSVKLYQNVFYKENCQFVISRQKLSFIINC